MKESKSMEILKNAILLEKRGKAFYGKVAQQTKNKPTRVFFQMMADEEEQHIRILSDQFKAYQSKGSFHSKCVIGKSEKRIASSVFTDDITKKINAASFEAAAISAAMAMEERAIRLYSERAKKSRDSREKSMYRWLAQWETEHLEMLSRLDHELTERIWNDNRFWPF